MVDQVNLEQCEEILEYLKLNTDRFVKELQSYPLMFSVLGYRTIFMSKEDILNLIAKFEDRRLFLIGG